MALVKMTTKQKFNTLRDIVNDCAETCADNYTIEMTDKTILIRTDSGLSGVLVKDIATICTLYCWAFGIYTDKNNQPYIHICA